MKRCAAFTLVETALALGLLAFCGMALLAVLPLALRQTAESLHETRASHLSTQVFATLRAGPYTAVPCFGQVLDLSTHTEADGPVRLYASFPDRGAPLITSTPGADTRATLELRFHPYPLAGRTDAATRVTLDIRPGESPPEHQTPVRFQSLIANP